MGLERSKDTRCTKQPYVHVTIREPVLKLNLTVTSAVALKTVTYSGEQLCARGTVERGRRDERSECWRQLRVHSWEGLVSSGFFRACMDSAVPRAQVAVFGGDEGEVGPEGCGPGPPGLLPSILPPSQEEGLTRNQPAGTLILHVWPPELRKRPFCSDGHLHRLQPHTDL